MLELVSNENGFTLQLLDNLKAGIYLRCVDVETLRFPS